MILLCSKIFSGSSHSVKANTIMMALGSSWSAFLLPLCLYPWHNCPFPLQPPEVPQEIPGTSFALADSSCPGAFLQTFTSHLPHILHVLAHMSPSQELRSTHSNHSALEYHHHSWTSLPLPSFYLCSIYSFNMLYNLLTLFTVCLHGESGPLFCSLIYSMSLQQDLPQ